MASTIDDVARAAGVSTSTVSYVLSGKRPISAPTRQRVERAIRDLGYRPHAGARALASSRTNVLALMAPLRVDVNVSVIMQFVTGVVTAARTYDHDVLLLTADEIAGMERVATGSMVDALVMMDIEADDPRVPVLARLSQPAVLIGLPRDPEGLSCVDLDFDAAGRLAVRHLTRLGHRQVALVGSPRAVLERHTSYAERMIRGFTQATSDAGVEGIVEPCESSMVGAVDAIDRVLARQPDVTALVVHNEVALPWVLAALRERGRRVPDDVSVLAVCPPDVAVGQPLPLTSIDIPAHTIGTVAVEMAMARVEKSAPAETRLLTPQLVERASTVPPAR
ncbi:LacI family DNA-binding transcriptional regulator [Cellulomonas sp. zg-ZUI199]|uniref:LacI family DNA-binding transcriptional regulator n=1 Tax=Cellulomonas wangleii TaxID=2816956 RepID=A0ABX8D7F4_9CELL|nr:MULTISPECIES: LacI family DNA-binding transcriptional regulator [Cellulomonas]MBO0901494.1 LacI family DNA-binding transcriptional regulator [Cellulomonas sp. zg-ZUI22]MBO0926082.1 LacI family DNA-binding transcriptional regulator [Cellulomonas wangleii]QVI63368.1 LacI family DNA-binding transcriptional regulator [Cellulomonas wangleii]